MSAIETTLDILNAVQGCPVWRKDADTNEIGEDCAGCAQADPDRARVCRHVFGGGEVAVLPDLSVRVCDLPEAKERD